MPRVLLLTFATVLAGCVGPSRLPYSLEIPAVVLTPVARSGIEDGRGRFREIYCAVRERDEPARSGMSCSEEILRLRGEPAGTGRDVHLGELRVRMRVLVVPGLYGDCLPVEPFSLALDRLRRFGVETGRIEVGGFSTCAANAARIRDAIGALAEDPGELLVLVAYSKGVPDLLEALVAHPEVSTRVSAVVSIAGVVAGSPLADEVASNPLLAAASRLSSLSCPERDSGALEDLRRSTRLSWAAANPLPPSVRYYSVVAFAERERISTILRTGYDLLARADPRNDGAVISSDAILPGGKLLGFAHADHWAVVLPFSREMPATRRLGLDRNEFPREALLEAVVRTVEEDLLEER